MKRQLSLIKQLVLLVVMFAVAAGLWYRPEQVTRVFAALQPAEQKASSKPRRAKKELPVVVQPVEIRTNDAAIEAIATARASRFVMLYSEVPGKITYLDARAGKRVQAGEIILELDSKTSQIAVQLGRVKVAESERRLARAQDLLKYKVKSQANVDDALTIVERTRLELAQAEDALSKRKVLAPFSGIIGIPRVETGDRVNSSTVISTLDDRSELLVEVEVPELHLARLKLGEKVTARTPSYPAKEFVGNIEAIASRVNRITRNITFRARFPNKDDLLRPGMSFTVEILIVGEPYPTVPELALQWSKGKSFVWRVVDNKVERVSVKSVRRLNSFVLVDGGLDQGDLVVVEGIQRLRPGRKVKYASPEPTKPKG